MLLVLHGLGLRCVPAQSGCSKLSANFAILTISDVLKYEFGLRRW